MTYRRNRRLRILSAAAATAVAFLSAAHRSAMAAPDNWQGSDATAPTWDQPLNWSAKAKPGSGDDAVFPLGIPAVPGATISLNTGEFANSLTFNDAYTLTGGTLTLTLPSAGITVAAGVVATVNSVLAGSAAVGSTGLTVN